MVITNHIHLIVRSETGKLSDTLRDFKRFIPIAYVSYISENNQERRREWMDVLFRYHAKYNSRVNEKQFWVHGNHAVELTTNEMIDCKIEYIHDNPVRAGWVENVEDYMYSSARNYAGRNGNDIIA